MTSPIQDALDRVRYNRLHSIVYFALNEGVPAEKRDKFRKFWRERGSYFLGEFLLYCASPEWESHPGAFWTDPWIASHLRLYEPANLCYILEQWLGDEPLPIDVSKDPAVEEAKVRDLERLFAALNP